MYNDDQKAFIFPQDTLQYIKRTRVDKLTLSKFFRSDLSKYLSHRANQSSQEQMREQEEKKVPLSSHVEKKTPHFTEKHFEQEIMSSP